MVLMLFIFEHFQTLGPAFHEKKAYQHYSITDQAITIPIKAPSKLMLPTYFKCKFK